jgi:hypothetical protein
MRAIGGIGVVALFAPLALAPTALAQAAAEDAGAAPPFQEGDVVTFEEVESLRAHLPPEFWANRDFFFYQGMRLEIGPFYRNYTEPPEFQQATQRFAGQPRIGPDDSLEGYTAGRPFPMETIDCQNDPEAGTKIMFNFENRWDGDGASASYYYSYWDRGEELPLYYEGTARRINLSRRVEKQYLDKQKGDLFRGEKRKYAFGIEVDAPFDARGIQLMTYRYKSTDMPRSDAKNDDTWVYLPQLRRVRRISLAQRTDAVQGTDFTFDDLRSFDGVVSQYQWMCLGEMDLIAPFNSHIKAFPYKRDHNFGPFGLSYADDLWEMRHTVKVRFIAKNADHPYHHKDIYIDRETLEPLYSFAYDRKQELWKIIWHNHRWSEEDPQWYEGWNGVPKPNDLRVVSDTIVNVQTGTGNRIEFWDNHGTPLKSKGKIRRYIDIGRLTKGR